MGLNSRRFIHNSGMAATTSVFGVGGMHVDTCTPNFRIQEYNGTDLYRDIVVEPIVFENGFIDPPIKAGLGNELDERVVQR